MSQKTQNINVENAQIGFRNFSGKASKFNAEGQKNFTIFLDNDLAYVLEEDGWNVRWLEPREEGDERQATLSVAVRYTYSPPKIMMISSRGKTLLNEETVSMLDWAEIESVDLIIRPYHWEVGGKSGVKAYLKSMYVTIIEDAFESKYHDIPFSGAIEVEPTNEEYDFDDMVD